MPLAPGPRGSPFLGSYRDLQRDPLGFFVRGAREYGHIFRFKPFPLAEWHFVSHPDHLEHLLQRHYVNYPKGVFARLNALAGGRGLVWLEGDRWLRRRKLLQPVFHGPRLAPLGAIVTSATDEMLESWVSRPDRSCVNLAEELTHVTLRMAGRMLCGMEIASATHAFAEAFRETLAYLDYRLVHPFALPLPVPTPRNVRYHRALARLNGIIEPLIEARRRAGVDTGDVLSALLAARDEDDAPLDDEQIREELRTALAAGHETTADTLFWSLYLLARHPADEERLHAEVDALGHSPTAGDLGCLPFTRMVIEEALRLYPPIVWLARVAAADDEIGGFTIPAGGSVVFSMYVTHRHPDFWERPDDFEPDRFGPERAAARVRGAYLPFGLGPRRCIGERLGVMEAMLALAIICRRVRLRLLNDQPVQPQLLATLRPPAGVLMRVEPR